MRWYGVLAVLVLLAAGVVPASAQHGRGHGQNQGQYGAVRPLDQILPQIRRSYPGTFYDAEGPFRGPDGRMHYRLKWMTPSGRILWLDTDAATGRVLGEGRRPVWDRGEEPAERRRYAPRQAPRSDHRDDDDDDRRQNFRGQDFRGQGGPSPFSRHDRRDSGRDWGNQRDDRHGSWRGGWRGPGW